MFHRGVLLALTSITTLGIAPLAWGQDGRSPDSPVQLAQVEDFTIPTESPSVPAPSEDVRMLQERLLQLGYYGGVADGIFNPETRAALSDFQQQAGLARTGILDPLTRQQLGLAAPGTVPDLPSGATTETPDSAATQDPFSDLLTTESDSTNPADAPTEDLAASAPEDAVASTPGDLAASAPDDTPADADAASEAQPADTGGGRRWLMGLALVGLVIALLGSVGGAVLLILSRRTDPLDGPDAPAVDLDPDTQNSVVTLDSESNRGISSEGIFTLEGISTVAPTPAQPVMSPLPSPPSTPEPQNGNRHPAPTIQDQLPKIGPPPAPLPTPSSALAATPPSRLSKVNILDELVQDLTSPDPAIRRKAIWELGQRGNSAAAQPLVTLMMDADSKERSLILAALAEISTRTLKPVNHALQLSLQDENPEVRKNAIRDLTRIYDLMGQASKLLSHATNDEDADVRQTAAWAMEQFNRLRLKATGAEPPSLTGRSTYPTDSLPQDTSHS